MILTLLLSIAVTQAPAADAPVQEEAVSVKVHAGDVVPAAYDEGWLTTKAENLRRGKKRADLEAQLADYEQNAVAIPKAAFYTAAGAGVLLIVATISAGVCAATNCLHK